MLAFASEALIAFSMALVQWPQLISGTLNFTIVFLTWLLGSWTFQQGEGQGERFHTNIGARY